jgi:AcrR family transcriptional regulator
MIDAVPAPPPPSPRTPRLPPEIRRRQILDVTGRLVAADGFSALTVEAVAREAGITRPVVYDLFGGLDGLVEAFIEDADARALVAIGGALPDPSSEPPDQLLEIGLRKFLEAVRADPDLWRIILLPAEGTPPVAQRAIERRRAELAGGVGELIDIAANRSGILAGVDRESFARIVIALAEDMARLVLEKPRRYTPRRISRAAGAIARLLPPEHEKGGGQA